MQPEIYSQFPPKIARLEEARISFQFKTWCVPSERASPNPFSFGFISPLFAFTLCLPQVPPGGSQALLKTTACYWHEISFPLSHKMSTEQKGEGLFFFFRTTTG